VGGEMPSILGLYQTTNRHRGCHMPANETERCRNDQNRVCRFNDEDVSNLIGLARRRDEIVDSINLAKRSTIFPKWALSLMIVSMAALFGIAISNRSAISALFVLTEQTHKDTAKIARAIEKHIGPTALLPTGESE
jgi:hypothetical protein